MRAHMSLLNLDTPRSHACAHILRLRDLLLGMCRSISQVSFARQEETWVDAFGSKDQLAYQYGYVLIACNTRGEFSPPSGVAMVRPKKDDRKPRSPRSRDSKYLAH